MIYIVPPLALSNEYRTRDSFSSGAKVCFPALKLLLQQRTLSPVADFGKH
jgi:hypothetical protein